VTRAEEILAALIAQPCVAGAPNGPIVDLVAGLLQDAGAAVTRIMGPEGDREAVFATIGPADRPGLVLSGHLDVVPAEEPQWRADPFAMRVEGDRLIGRGATDMKGFIAAARSLAPAWAAARLDAPIHFALSYDEELGCRGAPHMIARMPDLCAPPAGCLVGEPTSLRPALRHKGKAALRIAAAGVSGHSARPDRGVNAIHRLAPLIALAARLAEAAPDGARDPAFDPPWTTLQVGVIAGGTALNIIPDSAQMLVEARAIAAESPRAALAPLLDAAARAEGVAAAFISDYPGFAIDADHPFARRVAACAAGPVLPSVAFGAEAGLFAQAGVPTVICGPGDIARGHRPEEHLTRIELADAQALLRRLTGLAPG
jgi:acetylornithine deacetylase